MLCRHLLFCPACVLPCDEWFLRPRVTIKRRETDLQTQKVSQSYAFAIEEEEQQQQEQEQEEQEEYTMKHNGI